MQRYNNKRGPFPVAQISQVGLSFKGNCSRTIHSGQADFKATRSQIEIIIEEAGHLVIFYPKFHPELNWIEYYWGVCKYFARRHCNYSFTGLREMFLKLWNLYHLVSYTNTGRDLRGSQTPILTVRSMEMSRFGRMYNIGVVARFRVRGGISLEGLQFLAIRNEM
jgi:hypothetical protein